MDQPADAELVTRTRAGDKEAYKELVARYQGHVYGLAYSLANHWADAQDIAQEAFIRAYCNLDQLKDPARFAAWLRRVTFSVAMNWFKAFRPGLFKQLDGKADLDALDVPDFRAGPPEAAEKRELAEAVMKAVGSLPPKYRVPLTMFHLDGLSYQKVADFLDVPLGTAKSLVHRAQEKLRALLPAGLRAEAATVQEVFNEHKLPPEFARKVVEGVENHIQANQQANSVFRVIAAAMQTIGDPTAYEYLMGVSGAAFRIQFYQPGWCPSSPHAHCGFECSKPGLAALNYDMVGLGCKAEDTARAEEIRRTIMESIDDGIPVICASEEHGLVVGYADEGRELLARDYWDWSKKDGTKAMKGWPWGFGVFAKKKEAPDRRHCVRNSLKLALTMSSTSRMPKEGEKYYACGFAAYDAWIADLKDGSKFEKADEKQQRGMLQANAHIYWSLIDARSAAVKYLRSVHQHFDRDCAPHLDKAAELYDAIVEVLKEGWPNVPWPWKLKKPTDWTVEMRQAEAAVLSQARALEEEALAGIEQGLAMIDKSGAGEE